jgi:uncharacterized coiled-coil protein SlyX
MKIFRKFYIALTIVLGAAIVLMASVYTGKSSSGVEATTTQDVGSLDRRISLLEQRLFSIESSINRLQQVVVSQRSTAPVSTARDQELTLMREEIQRLGLRLTEVECGLLKLDERTAVPARNTRKSETPPSEPCRLNPGTPLRLSSRP